MLARPRDLDVVRDGVDAWLSARRGAGAGRVIDLDRPAVGWSCETLLATIETRTAVERVVLRLPPAGDAIFPAYDLEVQAAVQELAGAHGVPTASPVTFEADASWLGTPFLTMPFVSGRIPGEFVAGDEWILALGTDGQRALWLGLVDTVAAIHRCDWAAASVAERLRGARNGLRDELAWWQEYLDWSADGAPAPELGDALAWCEQHAPAAEPAPGLLWGDVRLGNVIYDERTLEPRAVLDWDMVSVGPAEMDLAWLLALESVPFELVGARVAGFPEHRASVERFERALGRDVRDLGWYEIFALVRSTAVLGRIATLFRAAGKETRHPIQLQPILEILDRRIEEYRPGS